MRAIIRKRRSRFCSNTNPSWIRRLTTLQLKNALTEVFLAAGIRAVGLGLHEARDHGKNRKDRQRVFRRRAESDGEGSLHQPIYQAITNASVPKVSTVPPLIAVRDVSRVFTERREDRYGARKCLV